MSGSVTIVLAGEPVAVSRVRFTQKGNAFTPTKTRNYLGELQKAAMEEMGNVCPKCGGSGGEYPQCTICGTIKPDKRKLLEGPLEVRALFEVRIPKVSAKRANAMLLGLIMPTKRPDLDNLLKALDALNGIVWHDDAQIVELHADKRYSTQPKVVITVSQID